MTAVALAVLLGVPGTVRACALPADPYIVVKVAEVPVGAIRSPNQFKPEVSIAGTIDPLTRKPYLKIEIPEEKELHFIALWDLTQGGLDPEPLGKLPLAAQLAASQVIDWYSKPGEYLLPVHHYFDKIAAGGKVRFNLSEMVSRSGRSFSDPLAVVDFGGFVKDGDYKLNTNPPGSGPAEYLWDDQRLERENAPFDRTFRHDRFPRTKAYNNDREMVRNGPRSGTQWVVTEAAYKAQGVWELRTYSNEYRMDLENLGANIGSEESPAANDRRVSNGDYSFTYRVPSDPLTYHIRVGSALIFDLKDIVWAYKEKLYEYSDDLDQNGDPIVDANGNVQRSWKFAQNEDPNEASGEILVRGVLSRDTQGQAAETRYASILAAVTDNTTPSHVHFVNKRLTGTTGETLLETARKAGASETFQVQVIDNNPFTGRGIGADGIDGSKFKKNGLGLDIYYAYQAYDYGPIGPTLLPVDLEVRPKFNWAKAATGSLAPSAVTAYRADGSPFTVAGTGTDANALYSIATYDVPLAVFDEPMGWHFATTSHDWGSGRKLKMLAAARDGTEGNQFPLPEQLPVAADPATPGSGDAKASEDIPDAAAPVADRNGQPIGVAMRAPVYAYPSNQHPASDCPADKFGQYAYVDVHDNDRPLVYLRVTDTKYDRKILFGNRYAGDLRWTRAQNPGGTVGNKEVVALDQRPYSDNEEVWEYDQVYGGPTGYAQQIADSAGANPLYNPSEYAKAGGTPTRYGYWCDEDIPLVFEVFARDNINWDKHDVPGGGWGITNSNLTVTALRDGGSRPELNPPDTWTLFDVPTAGAGAMSPAPWPQHIFRNPNMPPPNEGDCHVEVEVADDGRPEGDGVHRRKLIVRFFVMDNKLKIQSLEETRVRSSTGN